MKDTYSHFAGMVSSTSHDCVPLYNRKRQGALSTSPQLCGKKIAPTVRVGTFSNEEGYYFLLNKCYGCTQVAKACLFYFSFKIYFLLLVASPEETLEPLMSGRVVGAHHAKVILGLSY